MLRTLKDLFDTFTATAQAQSPGDRDHALQLGAAVLLVEVMRADPTITAAERASVLVQCCMLDGTNKSGGCWVRARRKPQRYPVYRADLQRRHGTKDAL